MRVLVVEDHPLMIEALRLALGTLGNNVQVTEASSLAAAMRSIEQDGGLDMVLLDLGLPDSSGLDALRRVRESFPAVPVVVISGADDPRAILAALDEGAMGFIPKTSPKELLLNAIRVVASGGIYVPAQALRGHVGDPHGGATVPPADAAPDARAASEPLGLSPRQLQVLDLLLKGLPNKLIARKLDISENTAKIHVSAVLRALGVSTRTQALIAASRLGLRLDRSGPN